MRKLFCILIISVQISLFSPDILVKPTQAGLLAKQTGSSELDFTANAYGNPLDGTFLIADQPVDTITPAVAYSTQRQEYLVVWWNDRPGNDDIYGQRVARDGKLLGPWFSVVAGPGVNRSVPDVAYNSSKDEYLVVWEQDNGIQHNIHGQRVSSNGLRQGSEIIVTTGGLDNRYMPAVAYASTSNEYLVVWENLTGGPTPIHTIQGQALTSSGALDGGTFGISASGGGQPDLAYNQMRNEFLVVWRQDLISGDQIEGRRVKMAGGVGNLGFPFTIFNSSSGNEAPAVAAIPFPPSGQYLVVFENAGTIKGNLVTGEGFLGSYFIFSISGTKNCHPAVVGARKDQYYYMVVWTESFGAPSYTSNIRGMIALAGGMMPAIEPPVINGLFADHAAVAVGPPNDFLITSSDIVTGANRDIWGRLWGIRTFLPLVVK